MPARLRPPPLALALVGLLAIVVAIVAALALSGGSGSGTSPSGSSSEGSTSGFNGALLPASTPVRDFTLVEESGRRVALSGYRGQVTILAFVYSACGPTCTLIAQQIRGALGELPHAVPVVLVTADPAVDTPARVRRFLASVSLTGRAAYLTGPPEELERVWREYGVTPATQGRAAFERSPSVILLDRSGRERVIFGLEQLTPEGLAHDVLKLS
jgi:protein SCO1/2